ncbi:TetR family transcriptional regulator [Mycobacterium shinjukuense]|uniref:TetR family transcriptional regulator n=1 Tax=Mycobacterium shinjukuense TaxID=398694 RepID=UPI0009F46594|nr:TetR family transcriptional regulator [Mycobacterium shinjukuense]ORB68084.1 hypothetical protein BST45_12120 [Mycobacterium shinjukuense]
MREKPGPPASTGRCAPHAPAQIHHDCSRQEGHPTARPATHGTFPGQRRSRSRGGLHAFATQGYHGVSLRALANELGISHNLLHQQFNGLFRTRSPGH